MTGVRRVAAVFALLAVLAGCGTSQSDSSQVTSVTRRYLDALASGNGSEACSLLSDTAKASLHREITAVEPNTYRPTTLSCTQEIVGVQFILGRSNFLAQLRSAALGPPTLSGDGATLRAVIGSSTYDVPLSKTSAGWRIDGLSVRPGAPTGPIYRVPSGSMEPTLNIGARVIVQPGAPKLGEIAVFHPPRDAEQQICGPKPHVITLGGAACARPEPQHASVKFVKRIVAGPGDQIYIREGHVFRKAAGASSFAVEEDSYIKPCGTSKECNLPTPITVPAGDWYMMGDNRGESVDSRFYGAIPTNWIVGIVTATVSNGLPG